jgi:hypothetical protein
LVIWGFQIRASYLLGRKIKNLTTPPALFALAIFQVGSLASDQTCLDHIPPIYASHITEMTGEHHQTQLVGWVRVSWTVCMGWP